MNIVGSLEANLRAALQSARRLKGRPVHPDTIEHWSRVLAAAKAHDLPIQSFKTREIMSDLEKELRARQSSGA